MPCDDCSCECNTGYHFTYYYNDNADYVAACLKKEEQQNDMFFLEGKNAYVDSWSCEHVLDARHIIDNVGTKLCVTMQQCIDKNQFVLGSKCITANAC